MDVLHGPDLEVKTLVDMLSRGQWLPHEVTGIERAIYQRKSLVEAGLSNSTARTWTSRLQAEVDNCLRMRWDFQNGWVIDRWIQQYGCWHPIGVLGFHYIRPDLCEYLKSRDLQRIGPERYLSEKRAAAERVRECNDQRSTDRVLAAVDSLSERRVHEFIEVERAMQTGDVIVAHGATEKMLDTMTAASKRAEQEPEPQEVDSITHPLVHRHANEQSPNPSGG